MNQNPRQNRQGRTGQQNRPHNQNNQNGQKRSNKNRPAPNRNQQPNSQNKQVDSRGPGGHQRGNAKQLYEKYKLMSQEKRASDRHESESLSQYAEHYYRVYAEFAAVEAAAQVAQENARLKRMQDDIERRANSAVPEAVVVKAAPEKSAKTKTDNVRQPEEDRPKKSLKLKNSVKPEPSEKEEKPVKPEKPKRPRVSKKSEIPQDMENPQTPEEPKKKPVRKPRVKKIAPSEDAGKADDVKEDA